MLLLSWHLAASVHFSALTKTPQSRCVGTHTHTERHRVRSPHHRQEERGGGGGRGNPKVCAPKMTRPDFPSCKFRAVVLVAGGGGGSPTVVGRSHASLTPAPPPADQQMHGHNPLDRRGHTHVWTTPPILGTRWAFSASAFQTTRGPCLLRRRSCGLGGRRRHFKRRACSGVSVLQNRTGSPPPLHVHASSGTGHRPTNRHLLLGVIALQVIPDVPQPNATVHGLRGGSGRTHRVEHALGVHRRRRVLLRTWGVLRMGTTRL